METSVKNPQTIFSQPQHLQVPVYQRRYVWKAEEQWEPLWRDITRVAELRAAGQAQPHFLGAVVTQTSGAGMGMIATHALVDGQQRLTTLQIVLDAAAAELTIAGFPQQAARLTTMTHNDSAFGEGVELLKLQHLNDDRAAFTSVMTAEPPIDYPSLPSGQITDAHQYFAEQVRDWLGDEPDVVRVEALVGTLTTGLQVVVISLSESEQSQEIFETLNARGTPLTAADLVKNFVFQQIAAEGGSPEQAYKDHWRALERSFWTKEISVGRYRMERLSLFLNHWLVAQTGDEVSTRSTFTRFQRWFRHEQSRSMDEVLGSLHAQADLYERWSKDAGQTAGDIEPVPLFVYRTESADIEAVKPLLLWLHDVDRALPETVTTPALQLIESWIMRRALLRRPASEYSRVVANLISSLRSVEPADIPTTLEQELRDLQRPGTYWPGDAEVREELATASIYSQPKRRLRTYLEAIEDAHRGYLEPRPSADSRVTRNWMTIEHLLPQRWKANWPVRDLAHEVDRDAHVHRLGNLTLLTGSLNSSVSNGPWLGEKGKRSALSSSDTLLMTRAPRLIEGWDESHIDARTGDMTDKLLRTWPAPADHDVRPVQATAQTENLYLSLKELVARGAVVPGTLLTARYGDHSGRTATVTDDGSVLLDGVTYDSPSGAGKAVLGRTVNGWTFWRLPDGRRLREARQDVTDGGVGQTSATFDLTGGDDQGDVV